MADKKEGKEGKDLKDFTPREMEIMSKAWVCMVEEPKVRTPNIASLHPTFIHLTMLECRSTTRSLRRSSA
jgi:hypothetical protein